MPPIAIGLLLTVTAQVGVVAQGIPSPVNANSLVRQMVANYQSYQTLQEVSEARFVDFQGHEVVQTLQLKYKRPNLLYLETHDPVQGTTLTYSNGHLATFFLGRENIYTHRTAPGTISQTLAVLSDASEAMTHVPQNQVLSPLSFLAAKRLPVEAANYRYVKTETVEGHRVALVTAVADLGWLKSLFPANVKVTYQKRDISLWIDLNTKLLVRAKCDLIWMKGAKDSSIPGRLTMVETHRNVTPNVPLRDEDFNIAPPKGSLE
jgi:outer membrane lipoprotein-sorting protein